MLRGCGEKGTLLHYWWECKLVQPLWRTVWGFLKKLEIELPYDAAIPLLGIHTEETRIKGDTCTPMFIVALFIIARSWKQPRCLDDTDVLNSPLDSVGEGEGRMVWGGRSKEGSEWGTHVHPWQIHVNVWQTNAIL